MKKFNISILSGLILCLSFSNVTYAQWSFTPTITSSGCASEGPELVTEMQELNTMLHTQFPQIVFPTKQECDMARNMVLNNFKLTFGSCSVYYICTQCTGSDIATYGQNANNTAGVNINGTGQGQAFYNTNNPMQNVYNWIDEWKAQYQNLYDWKNSQGYKNLYGWDGNTNFLPFTTDENFDKELTQIVKNASNAVKSDEQNEQFNDEMSDEQWLQAVEAGQKFQPITQSSGNVVELEDLPTGVNSQQNTSITSVPSPKITAPEAQVYTNREAPTLISDQDEQKTLASNNTGKDISNMINSGLDELYDTSLDFLSSAAGLSEESQHHINFIKTQGAEYMQGLAKDSKTGISNIMKGNYSGVNDYWQNFYDKGSEFVKKIKNEIFNKE